MQSSYCVWAASRSVTHQRGYGQKVIQTMRNGGIHLNVSCSARLFTHMLFCFSCSVQISEMFRILKQKEIWPRASLLIDQGSATFTEPFLALHSLSTMCPEPQNMPDLWLSTGGSWAASSSLWGPFLTCEGVLTSALEAWKIKMAHPIWCYLLGI